MGNHLCSGMEVGKKNSTKHKIRGKNKIVQVFYSRIKIQRSIRRRLRSVFLQNLSHSKIIGRLSNSSNHNKQLAWFVSALGRLVALRFATVQRSNGLDNNISIIFKIFFRHPIIHKHFASSDCCP